VYYLQSGDHRHDRLRNALLAALVIHAAVIAGVSFDLESGRHYSPQIEVTLATRPQTDAPERARNLAQANQEGRDAPAEAVAAGAPGTTAPSLSGLQPELATATDPSERLTTLGAAERQVERERAERLETPPLATGTEPLAEQLARDQDTPEAEPDEQSPAYLTRPRVTRVTSVAARESPQAAYLYHWLRRLEEVGNSSYPEASIRYGIYGSLRLLAVIRQDGSLEDVRILSSSGYAVLDEAAIRTVHEAAPFAPFPEELRATTDRLEIIRTWHFEENTLSSAKSPATAQRVQ